MSFLCTGDDNLDSAFDAFVEKIYKEAEQNEGLIDKIETQFVERISLSIHSDLIAFVKTPEQPWNGDGVYVHESNELDLKKIIIDNFKKNRRYYDDEQLEDCAASLEKLANEIRGLI